MGYHHITSGHLDVLKEIGNIGAGHAATSLSFLLDKKIDMKVPAVDMVSFDEMTELAGGAETIVVGIFLRIQGEVTGNMFFLLPLEQATRYVQIMLKDPSHTFQEPPYEDIALSAIQELGNIVSGAYLSSLSDFTGLSIQSSVPAVSVDMAGAMVGYGLLEISKVGDHALVIDTALNEEGTQGVKGNFYLILDPESFSIVFNSLGVDA
ncbi:chemotaxis protein CheC [Rossellomorea marisflavi]|uniref:Chemotaxis protein CheC n=1 Tax=Rossellomorea marisflavi TaxID=189381 RepID=A0A5D4RSB2_9BACI|nr:chemotaxis protein CheC [Rossellomorea marisflavi]KQU60352.1 CheY-P-specific phosphatase CheC [Bacillus sp. Leaf406]MBV6683273.1 chemotaxis protein CheC [Bacillus sp. JRC01]MDW4526512.1 chemotaxis protein CheC [Rossellomorea marisflavi]TYS53860.1 chemotaxis protein CheC [Rossellomorea marisflavi]UKS67154.1 chemotaxis protein CheC [Rossellomorea marisflavi]